MANKHLLVIDDDEDSRILVKFALEMNQEWQVSTAKDGIEGIVKAEIERPDVILLDFIMPNLDGLSVYKVLESNLFTCSIPIVFVTAMTQNKILALLENTSAEAVITKPFDLFQINSLLSKACVEQIGLFRDINLNK